MHTLPVTQPILICIAHPTTCTYTLSPCQSPASGAAIAAAVLGRRRIRHLQPRTCSIHTLPIPELLLQPASSQKAIFMVHGQWLRAADCKLDIPRSIAVHDVASGLRHTGTEGSASKDQQEAGRYLGFLEGFHTLGLSSRVCVVVGAREASAVSGPPTWCDDSCFAFLAASCAFSALRAHDTWQQCWSAFSLHLLVGVSACMPACMHAPLQLTCLLLRRPRHRFTIMLHVDDLMRWHRHEFALLSPS